MMNFQIMFGIFIVMFVLVIGTFIFAAVNGARRWKKNNDSPRLTVEAVVVAKRTHVSSHTSPSNHGNGVVMDNRHSSTTYFVTFEVESGDRLELHVQNYEYGFLIEGDRGKLSFQGTRYLGFNRIRS